MPDKIELVDGMLVVMVMPCLDEEKNLRDTCASLGFGIASASTPLGAVLIIVDNGSSDSTLIIADEIKCNSRRNTVLVEQESERGFVPPRNHGNLVALALAESSGWNPEQVLVLQIDADLRYANGYIDSMRATMRTCEPNVMIEACLNYPQTFQAEYAEYMEICNRTDEEFTRLFPFSLSHDELVVDAVTGYRLSDYFKWGGASA